MIKYCASCKANTYQDAKYGEKMRVMNECKPPAAGQIKLRCTVCENTITDNK